MTVFVLLLLENKLKNVEQSWYQMAVKITNAQYWIMPWSYLFRNVPEKLRNGQKDRRMICFYRFYLILTLFDLESKYHVSSENFKSLSNHMIFQTCKPMWYIQLVRKLILPIMDFISSLYIIYNSNFSNLLFMKLYQYLVIV